MNNEVQLQKAILSKCPPQRSSHSCWYLMNEICLQSIFYKYTFGADCLEKMNYTVYTYHLQPMTYNLQPTTYNLPPTTYHLQPRYHTQHRVQLVWRLPHNYPNLSPFLEVMNVVTCKIQFWRLWTTEFVIFVNIHHNPVFFCLLRIWALANTVWRLWTFEIMVLEFLLVPLGFNLPWGIPRQAAKTSLPSEESGLSRAIILCVTYFLIKFIQEIGLW